MAKGVRDMDIGTPKPEVNTVVVQDLTKTITEVTERLEEATEELKKIRLGTGLILGEEIEEAD